MKNLFMKFGTVILLVFLISSCSNENEDKNFENQEVSSEDLSARGRGDFYIPQNPDYTLTKDGLVYRAIDVYSRINEFQRKILISDLNGRLVYPEIVITFTSDDNDDIYKKITEASTQINGRFSIRSNDFEYFDGVIENSSFVNLTNGTPPVSNPNVPCNLTTIHDCVSYKIEEMNIVDLAGCFATAPGCYALTWASCTYDVCHEKIEYTNPVN